jgi:hypothetical protein
MSLLSTKQLLSSGLADTFMCSFTFFNASLKPNKKLKLTHESILWVGHEHAWERSQGTAKLRTTD